MAQGATIQVNHPVMEQVRQSQLGIAPGCMGAGHADAVDRNAGVRRLEPRDHPARFILRGGPKPRAGERLRVWGDGGRGHQKPWNGLCIQPSKDRATGHRSWLAYC